MDNTIVTRTTAVVLIAAGAFLTSGPTTHPAAPTTTATTTTAPAANLNPTEHQTMFNKLIATGQWRGGDSTRTVKLADGRALWLFADSFTNKGFVNSSALLQSGRTLTPANDGNQILPKGKPTADGRKTVYWIEGASPLALKDGTFNLNVAKFSIGTANSLDFERVGPSYNAQMRVKGNTVNFVKWVGTTPRAPLNTAFLGAQDGVPAHLIEKNRVFYQRINVAPGVDAINSNRLDGDLTKIDDGHYAPIFVEAANR